ncbi:uncharacterized protein K444DRAFT_487209, partial [Hyaloscypha bicolor E]
DVGELESWLNRCNNGHRQYSTRDDFLALPSGFRLIDVKRGCVITAKSDPIYCALSYVWGGENQGTRTSYRKIKVRPYRAFSGLHKIMLCIPDTLCRYLHLSQNYLRVDCLCILQDGEEDKHNQISSMDVVYNLALLTIVAAAGDGANAGLRPFNSPRFVHRRSFNSHLSFHVETISGIYFVSCLSPQIATEIIAESKWASRGWTLQEYILSKRMVVFTGRYVFFHCK